MSYKFNRGIKATKGIQIEFDAIEDFYSFNKHREQKNEKDHLISGFVKQINCQVFFMDEYNTGIYEWYVVNGKFLNYFEPLCFHSLEDYLE